MKASDVLVVLVLLVLVATPIATAAVGLLPQVIAAFTLGLVVGIAINKVDGTTAAFVVLLAFLGCHWVAGTVPPQTGLVFLLTVAGLTSSTLLGYLVAGIATADQPGK